MKPIPSIPGNPGANMQFQNRDGPIPLRDAEFLRVGLGSLLFLVVTFFSWNYSEFFGPDSVFYFARQVGTWPEILQSFSSLDDRGQYRPMGMLLFTYLFHPVFGGNAFGYHLIPVVLHIVNSFLVFLIARRLLESPRAALAATGFFALHRVNFFVTYGITFIPDFTGAFLFLAALYCYLRRDEGRRWLAASVVAWIAALFSKETAIVLPGILFAYEFLNAGRGRDNVERLGRASGRTFPFLLIGLCFLGTLLILRGGSLYPNNSQDPYHTARSIHELVPKVKYLWWSLNLPQGSRITSLVQSSLGTRSVRLRPAYPLHTSAAVVLMMPFMAFFIGFVVRQVLRRDRLAVFGLICFSLGLAPVLPLAGKVMQHNLYFALLGFALLFGSFAEAFWQSRYRQLLPLLAISFLFSTGIGVVNNRLNSWPVMTSRISANYLEQFRQALSNNPDCAKAVVIERTGTRNIIWYTDGGNLFRVFGPCPHINVHFEDLGIAPDWEPTIRLKLRPSSEADALESDT